MMRRAVRHSGNGKRGTVHALRCLTPGDENGDSPRAPFVPHCAWDSPHFRGRRAGQEGVALILALVVVVLLTVIVVEFSYDAEVDASFAINQSDDFEAYLAAKSSIAQGMALLAQDAVDGLLGGAAAAAASGTGSAPLPTGPFDSLTEPWSAGIPMGPLNNAQTRATIVDEYGKINLNALFTPEQRLTAPDAEPQPNELVMRMLVQFFAIYDAEIDPPPEELVAAIMDWIDPDDEYQDYVGAEGAESDYYEEAENPYPCKDGPMDSIEELLLIRGFTPEIYFGDPEKDQLPRTEYLTVHGDPGLLDPLVSGGAPPPGSQGPLGGRININTAHEYVLQALALAVEEVPRFQGLVLRLDQILEYRLANGGFLTTQEIANFVEYQPPGNNNPPGGSNPSGRNTPAGRNIPPPVDSIFTVTSDVFRIRGDAVAGETMVRIEAYVFRNPTFLTGGPGGFGGQGGGGFGGAAVNTDPIPGVPEEPFRILEWKVIR